MRLAVLVLSLLCIGAAQPTVSKTGPHRMEITVERYEKNAWRAIDPSLVLDRNDRVRFRFRANFSGYLYVTNMSTSNTTSLLFPTRDTGDDNRIVGGRDYVVPATQGAFRVDGPAGYDVVSWTVSPVRFGESQPATPARPPADMKPRCDDNIFRARGACVDTAAGPQSSQSDEDLVFLRERQSSVVASRVPLKGPVVYEFYLAHR